MELVDQAGLHKLTDRRDAAPDADVLAAGCDPRLFQGRVNTVGDEPELRAPLHPQRWSRVMRQHEHRHVVRRIVAPPSLPVVVGPWSPDGAEHVAPKNPAAEPGEAT